MEDQKSLAPKNSPPEPKIVQLTHFLLAIAAVLEAAHLFCR